MPQNTIKGPWDRTQLKEMYSWTGSQKVVGKEERILLWSCFSTRSFLWEKRQQEKFNTQKEELRSCANIYMQKHTITG